VGGGGVINSEQRHHHQDRKKKKITQLGQSVCMHTSINNQQHVHNVIGLLLQCVLGNRLECLLDVGGVLGTSLEISVAHKMLVFLEIFVEIMCVSIFLNGQPGT
jgi:hypothetical protein